MYYYIYLFLGAMVQYFMDPTVLLVGASGGVYTLITAHLANTVLVSISTTTYLDLVRLVKASSFYLVEKITASKQSV